MKYRKKPVVIEAIKCNGINLSEIKDFVGEALDYTIHDAAWQVGKGAPSVDMKIKTLEGDHTATVGDYIIKGVKGEFYPCKPDIFEQTYDAVEITEGPPDWMAKAISLYTDLHQITEKFDNEEMKEFAELCETVNLIASCKG